MPSVVPKAVNQQLHGQHFASVGLLFGLLFVRGEDVAAEVVADPEDPWCLEDSLQADDTEQLPVVDAAAMEPELEPALGPVPGQEDHPSGLLGSPLR